MILGEYHIDLIETCTFGLDGGAMFGVVPKTLWERTYTQADQRNRIPMTARALLIRGHGRTILVDTGNSPYMSEKEREIYAIDFSQYTLEGSLARLGVQPTDITDVILTHLHFDHCGGAVVERHGAHVPRFPQATYYVQQEHLAWARNPTLKDRASFMPAMFEPLVQHSVLTLLDGPGEIFPGIRVQPLHGHTAAMQAVWITSQGEGILYPADLMPTGAHVPLPYVMGYDNHPLITLREKEQLLREVVDRNVVVVFEHDALRQAARVVWGDKGPRLGDDVLLTSYDAPHHG